MSGGARGAAETAEKRSKWRWRQADVRGRLHGGLLAEPRAPWPRPIRVLDSSQDPCLGLGEGAAYPSRDELMTRLYEYCEHSGTALVHGRKKSADSARGRQACTMTATAVTVQCARSAACSFYCNAVKTANGDWEVRAFSAHDGGCTAGTRKCAYPTKMLAAMVADQLAQFVAAASHAASVVVQAAILASATALTGHLVAATLVAVPPVDSTAARAAVE